MHPCPQVQDCKFAPNHWGLKLATLYVHFPAVVLCNNSTRCDDGHIRIYEAENVMNLSTWSVQVMAERCARHASCLCLQRRPRGLLFSFAALPILTRLQADFLTNHHSPAFAPIALTW